MTDPIHDLPTSMAAPSRSDRMKVDAISWMRTRHAHTVGEGSRKTFRHRKLPASGLPLVGPACDHYPDLHWLPPELLVPRSLPAESRLPMRYVLPYYGLGKLMWGAYDHFPLTDDVLWESTFEWNSAFPPTGDGWQDPTSDDTFMRLRLQGPNPWLLAGPDDAVRGGDANYTLDFTPWFEDVFPDVVCEFGARKGKLSALSIVVDGQRVVPGDPGWDNAKRVANALDARYVVFVRHLLHTHLIVGQAFALSAYGLPPWHPIRSLLEFFTYGTLEVNDLAFKGLLASSSYFLRSGFVSPEDVRKLFENAISRFDFDEWLVPNDLKNRHLDAIDDHPYRDDATLVWPEFKAVVDGYLDDLRMDNSVIVSDLDLQRWYLSLASFLPNTDVGEPLDRDRLSNLLTSLIYNNVIHEVCGDMSPIMGSRHAGDRALVNLGALRSSVIDRGIDATFPTPSMADVFLMDQASYVSRFNVGGNNLIDMNAARCINDPRLRIRVCDLQDKLRSVEGKLRARNVERAVNFARMLPSNWEASISF